MSRYTKFRKSKRKKILFTVKAWKKFDITKQMVLTNKYQIILKDYKTNEEKLEDFIRFFNMTSLDNVLGKIVKGINSFSKMMDGMNGSKMFPVNSRWHWQENNEPVKIIGLNSKSKVNIREAVYGKPKDVHKAVWG